MDTTILEDIGLTKGEARTYLTLLKLGKTKVGNIIEKSGMVSSATHNSINSLIDKGLISYIKIGKIKYYQAISPKQLIDFINEKKQNIIDILPQLEAEQKELKERQEAEIFVGTKGITTMLNLLIEDTKKDDEYLFFAINVKENNKEIQKFFLKYDNKRKDKGLIVKGLAPENMKELFINRKVLKMKYTKFPIPSNISICKNKIALFSWSEKPVGFLIISEQIAAMYKDFFNNIWLTT